VRFILENRSGDPHTTRLRLKGFPPGVYVLKSGRRSPARVVLAPGRETVLPVLVEGAEQPVVLRRP
jgi:hypothetical protein